MSTNAVLTRLAGERDEAVAFIENVMENVESESRDVSDTEQRSVDSQRERIAAIDAQMRPLADFQATRNSAVAVDRRLTGQAPRVLSGTVMEGRSIGDSFTDSDCFRNYSGGLSGRVHYDARPSEVRAVLTTAAEPGKSWMPTPVQFVSPQAAFATPLLDAIQRVPVSSGSVDIVAMGMAATGAAVVAEGEDKPEATLTTTVTPTSLETIAAWVQTSRQLMADAPSARNIIDNQLTRGILTKLEGQVAAAIVAGGIPALTTVPAEGGTLAAVRAAVGQLQAAGYVPGVVMANPVDLATLDIDVFTQTLMGPTTGTGYWGLRPVPVPGLTPGTLYVADAGAAFALFERTGVEVYMTDSDIVGTGAGARSAFRANILTVLAETRAVAAVINAGAAVGVTVAAA